MMQYYVWSIYEAGSGFAFCESMNGLTDVHYNQLVLGQKLDPVPEKLCITKISKGEIGDSLGTIWGLHIVSENLKKVLPVEGIQFIPVTDSGTGIKLKKPYFFANVVSTGKMNKRQSVVEMSKLFPDEIESIKKLIVKEFAEDSPPIFRLEEVPDCIIISKSLKLKIESITKTGGYFVHTDEYGDYIL